MMEQLAIDRTTLVVRAGLGGGSREIFFPRKIFIAKRQSPGSRRLCHKGRAIN